MQINNCEQGSEEWFAARRGIPTASEFKSIFTSQGKVSASQSTYMYKLIAEWLMDKTPEAYTNEWMERGKELESEARAFYELRESEEVQEVGFVTLDSGMAGCSPDGLLKDGGLELKCPAPHTHVKYLLAGKCPAEYIPQVQGSMWICGALWWDFMSYHPDMPPLVVRVNRDQKFVDQLSAEVGVFTGKLFEKRQQLPKQLGRKADDDQN